MATDLYELQNDAAARGKIQSAEWNKMAEAVEVIGRVFGQLATEGFLATTAFNVTPVGATKVVDVSSGYGIIGSTGFYRAVYEPDAQTGLTIVGTNASPQTNYGYIDQDGVCTIVQNPVNAPANSMLAWTLLCDDSGASSVNQLPTGRINLNTNDHTVSDLGDTMTGALAITPSTDVVPLTLTANVGLTANLLNILSSTGVELCRLNPSSQLRLIPLSSGSSFYDAYGYGTSGTLGLITRMARGTRGSETAVQANDILGRWSCSGHRGSSLYLDDVATMSCRAAENFAAGAGGTYWRFATSPIGSTTAAEVMRIASLGVGIGVGAANGASAILQLDSTTQGFLAPRWTTAQRDAISSPATGLHGFDTDQNALTIYGSRWNWVPGVAFVQKADGTLNTSNTETTIIGSGNGSLVLPANFWKVGKTIRFKISGYYGDTGTPTLTFKFKLDAVTVITSGAITLGSGVSNKQFVFEGEVTCRAVGGSGTVRASSQLWTDTTMTPIPGTANVTVDTTQSDTIDITAQWSASSASNALVSTNLVIEILS